MARPGRARPDRTMVWSAAKLFIVVGVLALGLGVWLAFRPVTNPGVQDCGPAISYLVSGESNVVIRPGEPGAPADAVALASQPTCRDRAIVAVQQAALAAVTGFGLVVVGTVLGLVDDRLALRRAPRYESYLRPMPREVRVRYGLDVDYDAEELTELPPVEGLDVATLGALGAAALVGLPFLVDPGAVADAVRGVGAGELLGALALVVLSYGCSALARLGTVAADPVSAARGVLASAWAARVRPALTCFGYDLFLLRRTGADPDEAEERVEVLQYAALTATVVVLVAASVPLLGGLPDGNLTGPQWIVAGVVAIVALSGLFRVPAQVRALPVVPTRAGWRRVRAVLTDPPRAAAVVAGSVLLPVAEGFVLVAVAGAFGPDLDAWYAVRLALVATILGTVSQAPSGSGVHETIVTLGLLWIAPDPAAAVAVALTARILAFWLPMVPAALVSRATR